MENFIIRECSKKEGDFIVDKIVQYNSSQLFIKESTPIIWINRVIEDPKGDIIGGILCKIYCGSSMYIDVLWIKEEYRKEGLGSKLLKEAEDIGKEKGCHLIHLDTFDFQAKDFYLKYGYEVFGTLDNCPKDNHKRYFMKKEIR